MAPPPPALVVAPPPAPVEPTVTDAVGTTGPVSPSDAVAVGDTAPRREGGARAGSPQPLANTGATVGLQVAAALAALLVGLLLVGATRRRQQR
ncbi:MAG: LPXTG cell wall anchor domain-containing protein [Mycobacteriaceae bacterium]